MQQSAQTAQEVDRPGPTGVPQRPRKAPQQRLPFYNTDGATGRSQRQMEDGGTGHRPPSIGSLQLNLDPAAIDRATVTDAFIGVDGFESDLVCDPWSFGEGEHHNANHAGRIVELTADGSWKLLKDCFEVPDPELADIVG